MAASRAHLPCAQPRFRGLAASLAQGLQGKGWREYGKPLTPPGPASITLDWRDAAPVAFLVTRFGVSVKAMIPGIYRGSEWRASINDTNPARGRWSLQAARV